MADGPTHRSYGALAGAGYSAYRARHQEPWQLAVEVLGGTGGGVLGGGFPDVVEPAIDWHHRRTAHSLAAGTLLVALAEQVENLAAGLRQLAADHLREARLAANDEGAKVRAWILATLCLFLAGLLNGLVAGYLSHLILDGLTPAGLPLA